MIKKERNKKIFIIILISLLIIILLTYFIIFKPKLNINDAESNNNIGELKELTDNSMFTIYLDGKKYTGSLTWPEGAIYQKAECENEEGEIMPSILTFGESKRKAYVKNVEQTVYCYLYFTTNSTDPDPEPTPEPNPEPSPNPNPEPSEPAPTCNILVTSSGVTLNTNNATSWYLSTSSTTSPSYTTSTQTKAFASGTYYGYVKNSSGITGTCTLEMYKATQHGCTASSSSTSGGGYGNCRWILYKCSGTQVGTAPGNCEPGKSTYNADFCKKGGFPNPSTGDYGICTCDSYPEITTYTCSNGQTCTTSGCCASMFCGSDPCRSGYKSVEPDSYTRYCYK